MKDCALSSLLQRLIPDIPEDNASLKIKACVQSVRVFPTQARLIITVLFSALPIVSALIALEEKLEKALGISEVIVAQKLTQDSSEAEKQNYAAELMPWILRHCRNQNALCYAWLQDSKLTYVSDCVKIAIPPNFQDLVHCQGYDWLENFLWNYSAVCAALEVVTSDTLAETSIMPAPVLTEDMISSLEAQRKEKKPTAEAAISYKSWSDGQWGSFASKPWPLIALSELTADLDRIRIRGELFDPENIVTRSGSLLVRFSITDQQDSITCRLFTSPADERAFADLFAHGYAELEGRIKEDSYLKEPVVDVSGIRPLNRPQVRTDAAPVKRVELHAHSKMSAKDGVIKVADLVTRAAEFGHSAIALTDHGVVQGFPEAAETAETLAKKGKKIKLIYGLEGYLIEDGEGVGWITEEFDLDQGFIAIDVETTGLDPARDRLIEVAAIYYESDGNGSYREAAVFSQLINPEIAVESKIRNLTGITDEMLQDQPTALPVLSQLTSFMADLPVVGHNVLFDLAFLRYEGFRTADSNPRLKFNPSTVDTLLLARRALPGLESYNLNTVAAALDIELRNSHRAEADARTCGQVLIALLKKTGCTGIAGLNEKYGRRSFEQMRQDKLRSTHFVLLAQDELGLYNLYRLVSLAHLDDFYYRPRIRKSWLRYFGNGLIKGSACSRGAVYLALLELYRNSELDYERALAALADERYLRLAREYDYLEIQPLTNTSYLLEDSDYPLRNQEDLKNINRLIVELGKLAGRPVCATCDAHYLDQEDQIYRNILIYDQGFAERENEAELFFRTTEEMLEEFSYLGEEETYAAVITNPNRIADRVKAGLLPFPAGSFPPLIEQAEEILIERTWAAAQAIYGQNGQLPELVENRIKKELNSICDNGFAVMYYITSELVRKSNADGYIVGSRGSVGSSFVATLCGITEVNPLPPHYVCPDCHYTIFDVSGEYGSGYDLPAKACPQCEVQMIKEGQDIPFETFLGFEGNKQPDIDLNFSGEYQSRAHQFIEEMFGSQYTFRAGTISSYAEKNSNAMVHNYHEQHEQPIRQAEIRRLAAGISGVKRTTGQHPGGIVIVPREREIYDFTPIQFPADKADSGVITTHFDFNSMHDTILKLDILGHDDPSMLKMLGDITGIDVTSVPIPDPDVMSLFQSTEVLGIAESESSIGSGVIGIPEMGTFAARRMIAETKPLRYHDLVQISGLSHGRGVWAGNAQDLISEGICTINDVIGCRDDIMTRLIYAGVPNKTAFDIMERVRKGRGLQPEHEAEMRAHDIPEWYIESCQKIQYMFPKAHAVAYTISSLRIAWFKVHRPEAYYCAYFTVRANEFDSSFMCQPQHEVRRIRRELGAGKRMDAREQRIYYILELVEEMQQRGIDFLPITIEESRANEFYAPKPGLIRPPLAAIPGVSAAQAEQIVQAGSEAPFQTQEDLARRAGVGPAVIAALQEAGAIDDLPESDQIDLFSLLEA
ncbi:MAG: PolC-type DNA polymerase III [Clostridiaceae bacterium]|nr:PolC-type DNA polymerase III [Clostridiaceae bacterium]